MGLRRLDGPYVPSDPQGCPYKGAEHDTCPAFPRGFFFDSGPRNVP
jgi:hypothetical protein